MFKYQQIHQHLHKKKLDYFNQLILLPQNLEELIQASHPVRVVNQVIESIDIKPLIKSTKVVALLVTISKCF